MNINQDNFFKESNNSLSLENDSFAKNNAKGEPKFDIEFEEDAAFLKGLDSKDKE